MSPSQELVLRELSTLPEEQLNEVLDFIRFLKVRALTDEELSRRFRDALAKARGIAAAEGISESDVAEEIRKTRLGEE